ncbi:YodC family protein [Sphingobacterium detergens]|uniref:YodC family protein n=1 Tax=Sphingobacterium detergens TaxID=1145106 RepID=UPI003AABE61E
MAAFNAGDLVQLKSGGPKMTVESFFTTADGDDYTKCVWYEKDDYKTQEFLDIVLQPFDDGGGFFL